MATDKRQTRDASGRFVKGGKRPSSAGRKKGTQNKYKNIRDRLKDIIMPYLAEDEKKLKTLAIDLQAIDDPKERIDAVAKILPFVIPKYSSTTISADSLRPKSEEERLLELDKEINKSAKKNLTKEKEIIQPDDQ